MSIRNTAQCSEELLQFVCLNAIKCCKTCHNKLLNCHCHPLQETPRAIGGTVHFLLQIRDLSCCQCLPGSAGMEPGLLLLLGFAASGLHLHFQLPQEQLQGENGVGAGFKGVKFWLWLFLCDRVGIAQYPGHGEGTSCGFIIRGLSAGTGNHKPGCFVFSTPTCAF